jgi:hypothetical protein
VVAQSQKAFPASAFSMEAAAESLSISSWKLIQKLVDSFASGLSLEATAGTNFQDKRIVRVSSEVRGPIKK